LAKDYTKSLATAKRLIRNAGRQVTFLKVSGDSSDPAKPWLGASDPRGAPDATATVSCVAVQPGSTKSLGFSIENEDLLARTSQVLVCEPGEDDPENLHTYTLVQDGGHDHKITFVERLRPANLTLLYFVGVAR
jgi:hypothetical protein